MKIRILILNLIIMTTFALAEGGSNYSIFGLGDLRQSASAPYNGMGGAAVAVPFDNSINLFNPAMWSYATTTRFQIGYNQNQAISSDGKINNYQTNGKFDGAQILFSLDTANGIAMSFGLNSNATQNYNVSTTLSKYIEGITANGVSYYQGSGGLTNFYIGASTKLFKYFSLGAYYKTYVGKAEDYSKSIFFENYSFTTATLFQNSYTGGAARFGLGFKYEDWTLGAFYETPAKMNAEVSTIYQSVVNVDTTFSSSYKFTIPAAIGFGASFKTGKFLLAADYKAQDFTGFDFRKRDIVEYVPSQNFSLGVARFGSKITTADYFDKITYKLGLGYNTLYYKVNGQNVSEVFGTYGMQFPLPGTGLVDAAIAGGQRGSIGNGLIREIFFRMNFSLSIGESWFHPFRREYE